MTTSDGIDISRIGLEGGRRQKIAYHLPMLCLLSNYDVVLANPFAGNWSVRYIHSSLVFRANPPPPYIL
jgi:hypothetical protein